MRLPVAVLDTRISSDPLKRRLRRLLPQERSEEALAFIELYYREHGLSDDQLRSRKREVIRELRSNGWYQHTPDELAFGARVAWRNSGNCIGRLFWKALEVFDCRHVVHEDDVAGHLFQQMRFARAGGKVRSTISIFGPVGGQRAPVYVENAQLIQYAGYLRQGGILGDPKSLELTRIAEKLGWPLGRSEFDVLPLVLRTSDGRRSLYDLPEDTFGRIPIHHPEREGLSRLGLEWYDVPYVSDMILTIGGVDYPCAPFNGFYMASEIACRNLVDDFRYNKLPSIADSLGLDRSDPFWRDEALTELNRAVFHSYEHANAAICDHHTAGGWYASFCQAEQASGRIPSGNWSWLVPPTAGALTAPFHMSMRDLGEVPNFYRSRNSDGERLGIGHFTELRRLPTERFDRLRRRWRRWLKRQMR